MDYDILNRTPIAQEIIARIDKMVLQQSKSFCIAKETTEQIDSLQNERKP
jgi:hypothetical protein